MRVLHVIDGLGGSGGAENRMVEEIAVLTGRVDHELVRLFEYDDLDDRVRDLGVTLHTLGLDFRHGSYNWPLAVFKLRAIARRFRPDVIHTSLFHANLAGQVLGSVIRRPVLSTLTLTADPALRGLQPSGASRRAAVLRRLATAVANRTNTHWRAVTEETKESSCTALGLARDAVTVVPRGVNPARLDVTPDRARFGIPDGVPLFVDVARHARQKGLDLLIDAFAQIHAQRPDAHLVVAGQTTDLTPELEARIDRAGLQDAAHLIGFRTDTAVLLASADVFVFPSLAEGIATSALEAMVAGVPVVAFDIAPLVETTAGGTLATLVPVGDVDALARASVAALDLRHDVRLLADRRRQTLDRYGIDQMAVGLERLLRDVSDRHRRGSGNRG